jgi:hypothetical protein
VDFWDVEVTEKFAVLHFPHGQAWFHRVAARLILYEIIEFHHADFLFCRHILRDAANFLS